VSVISSSFELKRVSWLNSKEARLLGMEARLLGTEVAPNWVLGT
jgi:hypothetical protein